MSENNSPHRHKACPELVEGKTKPIFEMSAQYPIGPGMLPFAMLQEMLGHEYFVRAGATRTLECEPLTRSTTARVPRLHDRRADRAA